MPNSIREQILQSAISTLLPIATAQGATLARSPAIGITREQSPALLIFPESDTIVERPNDRVERHLLLKLVALAHEINSEAAEAIADRLLVAAHAALFANANFGGLCLGIQELDAEWDVEDSDATVIAVPVRYQIIYRTLAADISSQG
jgi:hypothetical protein